MHMLKLEVIYGGHICRRCLDRHYKVHLSHRDVKEVAGTCPCCGKETTCVGITGLYYYPGDRDNAWLGWFGIRKPFRRQQLGSTAMRLFEEMAVARGYQYARLYTDAEDNDAAIAFYYF